MSLPLPSWLSLNDPTRHLREMRNTIAKFGHVFSVRESTGQTLTAGAFQQVNFNTVEYDFDGWYNTTTYRHIPKIPGYVLYAISLRTEITRTSLATLSIYLNGAEYKRIQTLNAGRTLNGVVLVPVNGTTDYVEVFVQPNTDNFVLAVGAAYNTFQGVFVGFDNP